MVTSAMCAALLLRHYGRRRTGLLLWSALCFVGLALNNLLLFLDLVVLRNSMDLSMVRAVTGAAAVLILVYGLVWERSRG
jgi:hypothetical protein